MSDQDDLPPGFPGGYTRIVGEITGEGEVKPTRDSNRIFTGEEMAAIWGKHPNADWKYVPTPAREWVGRKRKKRRQ